MKLWKKVYLLTMVIITITVNFGFLGIVYFSYEHMLRAEKERCEAEFEVVYDSLLADISQMEESISLDAQYFEKFLTSYNSYFEADTRIIGVVDDEILGEYVYPSTFYMENGVFIYNEEQTNIYCIQSLDSSHSNYKIIMQRALYDFDKLWDTLIPLYAIGGIVLSLGVSLLLAMVVRVVLKPLDELETVAKQVEDKNWTARVSIKGSDELAKLGRQFNTMAESIEDNVKKLELQSEQKQQLIHNMAHEMNTPITSIGGFAEYMQMGELSVEEQQECLNFIISESKRLKDISSTVLSMAELKQDEDISMRKFSLKELCNRLEKIYQRQFHEENITLEVICDVKVMNGNEVLIESLLRNLITNAYHAVLDKEDGKIKAEIYEEKETIKLQVSDNGCGMAQTDLEQIFEPFYRVDKVRSRERGGSGLGLAFCKRIVETHHGDIKVESELEKGTRFTITFTI